MASFDERTWRERASKRRLTEELTLSNAYESACIRALGDLVQWCESKGLTVSFTTRSGGIYLPEDNQIKISCRALPETQLYLLLHECGHHLIGGRDKSERFGMGYSQADDPHAKRTFIHRLDVVDEELEAWHRGWKLGQRLGFKLDRERFDELRSKLVKTYLKWALRVDGFGREDTDEELTDRVVLSEG